MALLEKITGMKEQGLSDTQIVNSLKEEGISMKEISEALSQARIKSAIYDDSQTEQMQPSIMQSQNNQPIQAVTNQAVAQEQYPQQAYPDPNQPQQYADQTAYYQQGIDIETVREVARQESEETSKKIRSEVESLSKLKTDLKFQIQNIDNRLQKVETIIQELQSAILRKIGEYGEAVSSISNELRSTQESFSKMINPIIDKKRGIKSEEEAAEKKIDNKKNSKKIANQGRDKKDNSGSFEDYFR